MSRLKKWDQRVLAHGNQSKWTNHCWFGVWFGVTQSDVIGAWRRKINLLWLGCWKGDNG